MKNRNHMTVIHDGLFLKMSCETQGPTANIQKLLVVVFFMHRHKKTYCTTIKMLFKPILKDIFPIMFQPENCIRFQLDILNIYIQLLNKIVYKSINISDKRLVVY